MNKLYKYKNTMNILDSLIRNDKDFREIQEKFNKEYNKINTELKQLLIEKINNTKDYDSKEYYKCYLEKLLKE